MAQDPVSDQTARLLRETWFSYLDTIESHRAAFYRYCRRLTRDVWDAEDLVQDTLLKGFAAIGRGDLSGDGTCGVANSRAYLFRIATNLWIDQVRRGRLEIEADAPSTAMTQENAVAARDAASALLTRTAPQERAAIILKDVFDFTLEEIAEMLSTTVGAIKSALHRGRASLARSSEPRSRFRAPSKELLDRFVAAFETRDVAQVTALLLETVTLEVPGVGGGCGKLLVWVRSSMDMPTPNNPDPPRRNFTTEVVQYRGQWIIVIWQGPPSDRILAGVNRFEEENGRIARIWEYHYCPDTIAAIADELGVKPLSHGYHQGPDILSNMINSAVLPWKSQ